MSHSHPPDHDDKQGQAHDHGHGHGSGPRRRQKSTVVETCTFIFLAAVIGAIALPNILGGPDKAREREVRDNMRLVQIAAESYAADHDCKYPTDVQDKEFLAYLPGGNPRAKEPGKPLINPYTGKPQAIEQGTTYDATYCRENPPEPVGDAGVVEYSPIIDGFGKCTSYAIRGASGVRRDLPGPGNSSIVFSKLSAY